MLRAKVFLTFTACLCAVALFTSVLYTQRTVESAAALKAFEVPVQRARLLDAAATVTGNPFLSGNARDTQEREHAQQGNGGGVFNSALPNPIERATGVDHSGEVRSISEQFRELQFDSSREAYLIPLEEESGLYKYITGDTTAARLPAVTEKSVKIVGEEHEAYCIQHQTHVEETFSLRSKVFAESVADWQFFGKLTKRKWNSGWEPDELMEVGARWLSEQGFSVKQLPEGGLQFTREPTPCAYMGVRKLDLSKLQRLIAQCPDMFTEHKCDLMAEPNAVAPRPFHDHNVDKVMLYRLEDSMKGILRFPWMARGPLREAMLDIFDQLHITEDRLIHGMIARLNGWRYITPHRDTGVWTQVARRVHVVVDTHPDIWFLISTETAKEVPSYVATSSQRLRDFDPDKWVRIPAYESGMYFELNNRQNHMVMNLNNASRTHIIFDYIDRDIEPLCSVLDIPAGASCGGKQHGKRNEQECVKLMTSLVKSDYGTTEPTLVLARIAYDEFGEDSEKFQNALSDLVEGCLSFNHNRPKCNLEVEEYHYGRDPDKCFPT